ncbi:MAG: hypothetical protein ABSG53_24325 [Thermoguttaceae bacterium]
MRFGLVLIILAAGVNSERRIRCGAMSLAKRLMNYPYRDMPWPEEFRT